MVNFNVIIERGEDGYYISEVVELPGCHTQGKTLDELMERTREAIELCLEEKREDNKIDFVGLQKIEIKNEQIASN
ncbi:type II toxin-antitoxin system HicB family antitoxin [Candidatus Pacearchaeota archaeon]|nr:type II toxin-antitoxin system HicB family antitoxin [Candidatus Pacearchaeota archaeon]